MVVVYNNLYLFGSDHYDSYTFRYQYKLTNLIDTKKKLTVLNIWEVNENSILILKRTISLSLLIYANSINGKIYLVQTMVLLLIALISARASGFYLLPYLFVEPVTYEPIVIHPYTVG